MNHLVIVCGHGIWLGGPRHGLDENEWLIQPFQRGETSTYVEHIRAGLRIAAKDPKAVVVCSGAATRKETRRSEGGSYVALAAANDYFGLLEEGALRVLPEEQALDSYYNILFSLLLFWRTFGTWPQHLTIVGHAFKKQRLVDVHCGPDALAFPLDRVRYVGIDPPALDLQGPPKDALDDWIRDPHGIGSVLVQKRSRRNPWHVDQRLFRSDDERRRSGLVTKMVVLDGEEETIEVLDGPQPWS